MTVESAGKRVENQKGTHDDKLLFSSTATDIHDKRVAMKIAE
jgi:hypothetical protein